MSEGLSAAIEVRQSQDTPWWCAARNVFVDEPPNRLLFAVLVGRQTLVQGSPADGPRGLAEDATPDIRMDLAEWGEAATDVSWVTCAELADGIRRIEALGENAAATDEQRRAFAANQIGRQHPRGVALPGGVRRRRLSNAPGVLDHAVLRAGAMAGAVRQSDTPDPVQPSVPACCAERRCPPPPVRLRRQAGDSAPEIHARLLRRPFRR